MASLLRFERMTMEPMCSALAAVERVPDGPGYYSIFIDDPLAWGRTFAAPIAPSNLIYLGIASGSLRRRLVRQDLRHESPASFFRSLGAVLGFRPKKGSLAGKSNTSNYRFTQTDTTEIIEWASAHLSVAWLQEPPLQSVEQELIRSHCPLFNIKHNPAQCLRIVELRRICRERACRGSVTNER